MLKWRIYSIIIRVVLLIKVLIMGDDIQTRNLMDILSLIPFEVIDRRPPILFCFKKRLMTYSTSSDLLDIIMAMGAK